MRVRAGNVGCTLQKKCVSLVVPQVLSFVWSLHVNTALLHAVGLQVGTIERYSTCSIH